MRSITCSGEHEEDNEDFLNEQSIIYYDCYRLQISWGGGRTNFIGQWELEGGVIL